jgi:hypothetical protein
MGVQLRYCYTKKDEDWMSGKPVCPIHHWLPLKHFPDDDIRQWECPKCGWMADDKFIKEMTPEKMAQIKKSHDDSMKFRAEAPARAQAKKIQAQVEGFKQEGKQKQAEAEEWKKKNKNVNSIMDYT